jgi:hypothetical protein
MTCGAANEGDPAPGLGSAPGSAFTAGVVVNHLAMHCLVPRLPFGGVGNSGLGAYHGE